MVDAVGGIDITIDSEELKYINGYISNVSKVTGKTGNKITKTGTIHMDGVQACSYCRIRYTDGRDMKRAERMRTVLEKVVSKLKTMSIGDINAFLDEVLDDFQTNISVKEIKSLIPTALNAEIESSFGWPYENAGIWQNNNFYGPAKTTESNVKKLHVELFGQEDYEVPEKVVSISNRIVEITGVGKE
jgi:anionic cell wall polymer biosynthesis LytR-Cps2A-Psr (LCP) family protein